MQTRAQWKAYLAAVAASGQAAASLVSHQEQAVAQAVADAWWRVQDVTFADLTPNGTTTRWALPGEDVTLLPVERQLAPGGLTTYAAFADVDWVYETGETVAVEPGVKADGAAVIAGDAPVCAIAAATAPSASIGTVRVWYARRVPQPAADGDLVRLPDDFARAAITGHYYDLLAVTATGGEGKDYGKRAEYHLARAVQLYDAHVPPVPSTYRMASWG